MIIVLGKILTKLLKRRLVSFGEGNCVFYEEQAGYRIDYSPIDIFILLSVCAEIDYIGKKAGYIVYSLISLKLSTAYSISFFILFSLRMALEGKS